MANAVIGTRSWFSTNDLPNDLQPQPHESPKTLLKRAPQSSSADVPVFLYRNEVTYNWLYGIPAIVTLAVFALVLAIVLFMAIIGRIVKPATMSMYLNYTSAGRLLSIIAERDTPSQEDKSVSYEDLNMKSQTLLVSTKSKPLIKVWEDENIYMPAREWIDQKGRTVINLEVMRKDTGLTRNVTGPIYGDSPKLSAPSLQSSYRSLPHRTDFQRLHSLDRTD